MRLFGCLVAQNEADIIAEVLEHVRQMGVFDGLFFYDLASDDGTFEQAMRVRGALDVAEVINQPYTVALREQLMLAHAERFTPGDWLAILDADEFYAEDPRPLLAVAEQEEADTLTTYQMEYALTDRDVESLAREDATQSIRKRRRHYLIGWSEHRFFRYLPDREGATFAAERPCSRRMLNRHYQYRSPEQIQTRIRTRLENRRRAAHLPRRSPWAQVFSTDWRDYVRPHVLYHLDDDGPPVFGLPSGIRVEDYRRPNDPFAEDLPRRALDFAIETSRR